MRSSRIVAIFRGMTPKQSKFARIFFECGNASEAYRQSYNVENMSDSSVGSASYELANNSEVVALVERMRLDAETVAQLSVAWVLRQYMELATADVNELIEARRVCCRYCHGVDHAYQWIDLAEWATELARVADNNERVAKAYSGRPGHAPAPEPLPSDVGGFGFWAQNPPHVECPKCSGVGSSYVHIHDTRHLKGGARLLYAGVKQTKEGIQVMTRNQDAALEYLARFLGMDKKTIDINDTNSKPVPKLSAITSNPREAARIYAAVMAGKHEA